MTTTIAQTITNDQLRTLTVKHRTFEVNRMCSESPCSGCHRNRLVPMDRLSRPQEVRDHPGSDVKGILVLIVCGAFTLLLFTFAALCRSLVGMVTPTVENVSCHLQLTDETVVRKLDVNNNKHRARTISHG